MRNYSDYETERQLAELENKISAQYNDAYRELVKKCEEYFSKFDERYQKEYKAYQDGIYTKAQFDAWVKAQIARGKHWERLRENAALRITKANETAASYINDTTPSIWTLNYNYTAYQADKAMGVSFDIYDENTVRRLIVEDPNLLPAISQKAIDRAKDTAWNREQFTKDVTSGILQGKAPRELAKTIKHTMGLNQVSAIRNARTAITSAQNGGRMDGYNRLASLGVQMQKEWMATLDGRTRDSHRDLDGERVPYDKPFSNGLQFPGDPQGAGREVWNCRCTMRAIFPENSEPRKMTYYGRNAEEAYEEKEDAIQYLGKNPSDAIRHTIIGLESRPIGKIKRGKPMTYTQADNGKVNPHKDEDGGMENCQTCALVFEARLRGYNVIAKTYSKSNDYIVRLSKDMRRAFVDPITGERPKYIHTPKDVISVSQYVRYMSETVKKNERYAFDVVWKNSDVGHVVNVDRTKEGLIRITDNQTNQKYVGAEEVSQFLNDAIIGAGKKYDPRLMRIDNMALDYAFVQHVVEKAERYGYKRCL